MNRRTFLCGLGKFLGTAAVAAVAPKFIFDCGKSELYLPAEYEEIILHGKWPFKIYAVGTTDPAVSPDFKWPERYRINSDFHFDNVVEPGFLDFRPK